MRLWKTLALGLLASLALAAAPAMAECACHDEVHGAIMDQEHTVMILENEEDSFLLLDSDRPVLDGSGLVRFERPIEVTGTITESDTGQHLLSLADGRVIEVPHMALVWAGDSSMQFQDVAVGNEVSLRFRADEPYRIMGHDGDQLIIGSYEGVFYLPEDFVLTLGEEAELEAAER